MSDCIVAGTPWYSCSFQFGSTDDLLWARCDIANTAVCFLTTVLTSVIASWNPVTGRIAFASLIPSRKSSCFADATTVWRQSFYSCCETAAAHPDSSTFAHRPFPTLQASSCGSFIQSRKNGFHNICARLTCERDVDGESTCLGMSLMAFDPNARRKRQSTRRTQ